MSTSECLCHQDNFLCQNVDTNEELLLVDGHHLSKLGTEGMISNLKLSSSVSSRISFVPNNLCTACILQTRLPWSSSVPQHALGIIIITLSDSHKGCLLKMFLFFSKTKSNIFYYKRGDHYDGLFPIEHICDDPGEPLWQAGLTHNIKALNSSPPGPKWPPFWQTFSNAFSWMKVIKLRFKFHRYLFPGVESTWQ